MICCNGNLSRAQVASCHKFQGQQQSFSSQKSWKMLPDFISTRRNTLCCYRWMKRARSKHWTALSLHTTSFTWRQRLLWERRACQTSPRRPGHSRVLRPNQT